MKLVIILENGTNVNAPLVLDATGHRGQRRELVGCHLRVDTGQGGQQGGLADRGEAHESYTRVSGLGHLEP